MPDNTPEKERLPEDHGETRPATPADLGQTQRAASTQDIPAVPGPGSVPTPPPARYPTPTGQHPRALPRKRKPPPRRRGGFLPPLWSVLLTMLAVLGVAFGLVLLVVSLGGQTPPDSPPRVVVVPAIPSNTPPPDESITILASPTIPSEADQGIQGTGSDLALQGPTLPPVVFTPTPDSISIGRTVMVVGVQQNQLNVRDVPGVGTTVLFRVPDGHTFTVIDGPTQAEGLTWWKVQDPVDGQSGWAASNYLQPVPEPR